MGTGYTKTDPTNFVDGETIQASDFTTEFNAIDSAFETGGHQHDGTDGEGGAIEKLLSNTITFGTGVDTDIAVTFNANTSDGVLTWMEDEDYFQFSDDILLTTTEKIQFGDTASFIQQSSDGVLRIDGEATIDMNASTAVTVSNDLKLDSDSAVLGFGSDNDITLTHAADTSLTLGGAGGTTGLIINNTATDGDPFLSFALSGTQTFTMGIDDGDSDKFKIGTSAIGTSTALTLDSSGNLVITGDLTVSGDDITMGTNTSGNLLIADGTNFNSVAVGSLSEISTVANDDVFLAVDTSGGGLKKIQRSAIVAGLATSGAISNVVEDTTPQLGGNLDTNSQNILIDDAHFIADENGNEQIIFQTTSSAVNQFDVTNAATGNAPKLSATGDDSNIDFELEAKGTGHLTVRGNTNSGAIQFNCENNSHGQIVIAQPHSAAVTNTLTLPAGSSSTLVSRVSTDTLTNKTLTTPVISAGADIKNGATSAGFVKFFEDSDNGTNAVTLIGPASTSDVTVTLPSSAGTLALTGTSLTVPDAGTIGSASDTDAMSISSSGVVNFTQSPTVSSAAIKTAGKETIWIPAAAMLPTASNGCAALATVETTSGRPDMQVLDFDASTTESAQFQIAFPKSWNEGNLTFQVYWTTAATDTDGVAWAVSTVRVPNDGTIDVDYASTATVTDNALGAAEDLCVSAESGNLAVASAAVGDIVYFKVQRDHDHSHDDMAEDARLIGIKLFFTTDAANDA